MRACKLLMVALVVTLFCLTILTSLSTNIWLSKWTDKAKMKTEVNNTSSSTNQIFNMNVYSAFGIAQGNQGCLDYFCHSSSHFLKVFLHLLCS
jgi:hypothetical protein